MHILRELGLTIALLATSGLVTDAFQNVPPPSQQRVVMQSSNLSTARGQWSRQKPTFVLSALNDENEKEDESLSEAEKTPRFLRLRRLASRFSRTKLVSAVLFGTATAGFWNVATPQAQAGAPVMAVPKAQRATPEKEALLQAEKRKVLQEQAEMQRVSEKASAIEKEEGEAARLKFEKQYKAQKERQAQEKVEALEKLKRDLLDQGYDPFVDLEGQRQVILLERGVDLGKVPGTLMYLEKQLEGSKNPSKSKLYSQVAHRRVIKAMVEDMKNKGTDPLKYFEAHQDRTQDILAMPLMAAAQMAAKYESNLEQYGQVNVPKEGETSVLEKRKLEGGHKKESTEAKKKAKEEQKRAKAEAKAKAAAEKQRAKKEKAAAKEAAKKEKAAAKEAAKKEKEAAAAAAATTAAASSAAAAAAASAIDSVAPEAPTSDESSAVDDEPSDAEVVEPEAPPATSVATPSKSSNKVNIGGMNIGVVPLAGAGVVAAGGGFYAFRMMQENAAIAEEERQRQFRMLMGEESGPSSAPALEVVDGVDDLDFPAPEAVAPPSPAPAAPAASKTGRKKKKKRAGFFGKKNKNDRETDLNILVSAEAKAPQFATLLAKILAYGAPGRFPSVDELPGDMPFQEFDVEAAKQKLVDARTEAAIEVEDSAEIFANVVNCMLIDIVDLASSTLKSKDDKLTVEGIKVVVDFMNHAASLYESVAGGVVITPVTYGGDLSKGKLEQMYSAYAASGMDMAAMMSGEGEGEDFQAGVDLLQDVFQISEKKAEGIAMKIAQKSMMEMMKDEKGMEEMMKQFGGGEGMEGLADMAGMMDNPAEIDPEQLKVMLKSLKEMKDSGAFGPEDFAAVKEEFQKAYGSSIDDVIKEGAEGDEDKELLELMKSILE